MTSAYLLAGCGQADKQAGHDDHTVHLSNPDSAVTGAVPLKAGQVQLPNGDLQEKTASADQLPAFLKGQPDRMVKAYQAAAKNTDLLRYIPCYCGCGESAGHGSNQNCFVKEVAADGSVVWDDHGTRCGVCVTIAETAVKMKQDGKPAKEIRAAIDKAYGKGFAPPTKTPLPS
ncbi:PCYCGC domain-containing protein [Paenibacillus sp. CC-CFT747]|nr:PCYCGC domain-containing protein [Paenibacillus sp. CC-CFT747]